MAVLNIEKSFLTENRSVLDFLNQSGQGLYIPLYQRDYSWDSDNIEQMLEDLTRGIQRIASGEVTDDNKEIRFLGTIITVVEPNRNHIYPIEIQALPSRIEKLIDGQQRVSTIALMAALLTKRLTEIRNKIKPSNQIYEQINEICDIWIAQKLVPIFSFDLGRGNPRLKPKIIRGAKDFWTRDESVGIAYKSELSNYLGHFIKAYVDKTPLPCLTKDRYGNTLLFQNARRIESWLKKVVAVAHEEQSNDEFATATDIIEKVSQDLLWEYERPALVEIVKERDLDKKSNSYILCELVQTLSVCHYLLDRCCFTIIQPTDDDWAFDMFQSLNATGTPLTAIETFKPTIVNTIDRAGRQFKDSNSDKSFKKIEDFLSEATTAQQKNKRTNDYLTSFFVAYDGRTMSTHFSYQRKALNEAYNSLESNSIAQENFIKRMGNYAEFYQMWMKYDGKDNNAFLNIGNTNDSDLVSMLILFLKASNHKMAITILASIYDSMLTHNQESINTFIETVKLVAAYYFLWRSTNSNSGLDSTYRDYFKNNKNVTVDSIKTHFQSVLNNKCIDNKEHWKSKAKSYLKYDTTSKEIIRLAILLTAHNTIPDDQNKGLIKIGREGCSKYLCLEKWLSGSLKTIEHIAPQSNKNNMWDNALYEDHVETFQSLGNLTLLPQDINSSAGNKGWKEKLLYYQNVAEKDPSKVSNIEARALDLGVTFNHDTIKLLQESQFNDHLSSISSMSVDDKWNKELVDQRTDRMLDIIWDRVSEWLF